MSDGKGEAGGCGPEEKRVRLEEHPLRWLKQEPTWLWTRKREKQQKADTEAERKKRKAEEEAARAADQRRSGWLQFSSGRKVEFRAPDIWRGASEPSAAKADGDEKPEDRLGSGIWKAVGWVATGITATGAIAVVGAAVTWIRFNEVGIPATQAVSVQPRGEALVLGAQETIIFVGIALVAVLLIYFADPKGAIRRITLIVLSALALGAAIYVVFGTHLHPVPKIGLMALAVALLAGCVAVGLRTSDRFWPLALSVFVASLVFSAATGILIVKQQKFVQGVAILRSAKDAGLTGVYVAATEKTIYFAQNVASGADAKSRMAMLEVPREGAAYAVGPLEPRADAAERETRMLEQLIANRERAGAPPEAAPKEPETDVGAKEEEAKKAETGGSAPASKESGNTGGSAKPSEAEGKTVAEAFGDGAEVTVHETVEPRWECLVRFASAGSRLLGKWWTSCKAVEKLEEEGGGEGEERASMLRIREALALPSRFQLAYDLKVKARLPKDGHVTYMTGRVAPQCEHAKPLPCGHEWSGSEGGDGVEQLYLPEPNLVEDPHRECTETRIDETPIWGECKEQG